MNQTIRLTLFKPQILESVKNETYFRGQVEKAADQKAIAMAYHEQAGNEAYQERILQRGLYTNLSTLKTHLSDYLSSTGNSSADNISSSEQGDTITITLVVGDRFNHGFTDPLAKLCSKYIEDSMLVDWWRPVNEKQAALYSQFTDKDLQDIKRCFNKTAPIAPSVPYPTELNVTGSAIDIGIGEEYTVTYSISDGAIDDIECKTGDPRICTIGRSEDGFTVRGHQYGHTYIELYSRHDPEISRTLHCYVTDQA